VSQSLSPESSSRTTRSALPADAPACAAPYARPMGRRIYIVIIMLALLVIAIGGWAVDAVRWMRRPRTRLATA
jgi:hypothetical protein